MATADKLIYANGTKIAIRDAIVAKGVAVPEETTFRQYATKIGEIETGGATSDPGRPSDWLKLSDHIAPGDRKIVGNYAVWPGITNYITINNNAGTNQRTITITLSDGSAPVVLASGDPVWEYIIDYNDLPASTTTSEGFRQCLVEIVADVAPGDDWQLFQGFNRSHSLAKQYSSSGWRDMIVSGLRLLSGGFDSTSAGRVFAGRLAFFEAVDGILPGLWQAFRGAGTQIRRLVGSAINFDFVLPAELIFISEGVAARVQKINLIEEIDLTDFAGTTINRWMALCPNLVRFVLDNAATITITTDVFFACFSLQETRLPGISVTFSIANCNHSAAALNTLFHDLAVVDPALNRTITITGNPGAATCDPTIATAKGWTVAA